MKLFLVTLIFCLVFQHPLAFAQTEVTPFNPQYGNSYIPGYCITKLEVLSSDKIYTCTYVGTTYYYGSNSQTVLDQGLYNLCWSTHMGTAQSGMAAGVLLKRQVFASFTIPETYQTPCKLKSELDPDEICNQPIDVNSLVRSAFGQRFPLDLFQGFEPLSSAPACPVLTITGQTFQLCYLNDLVASLKYVLLVVFIVSSVMAL